MAIPFRALRIRRITGLLFALAVALPLAAGDGKRRLQGTVIDERGLPVEGATVRLLSAAGLQGCDGTRVGWAPYTDPKEAETPLPEPSRTTTDAAGHWTFTLSEASSSSRVVSVEARSFEPALWRASAGEHTEIAVEAARPVRIQLLGPEGAPMAGLHVRLLPLDLCPSVLRELPALVPEARTDDDGNVEWPAAMRGTGFLEIDDGADAIEVGPLVLAHGSTWFRIRPSRDRSRKAIWRRAPQGETVATEPARIVVREERSGDPVQRAMLVTDHERQGRRVAFVSTDAGEVQLEVPAEGQVLVGASHPGVLALSALSYGRDAGHRSLELTVPDLAAVRGEVRSAVTGDALTGAEVGLTPLTALEWGGEVTILVASGGEGGFRFDEVPRGVYTLRASAPGHLAEQRVITVEGDDDASHTLVLTTWGSLRGSVVGLSDGETATVRLLLGDAGTLSNPSRGVGREGAFLFERVRPGPTLVYLETRTPEGHQRMFTDFVEVLAGKATDVRFDLTQGVELEGMVTIGRRRVVEGRIAFERYTPGQELTFLSTTTDGDGRYRVVLPVAGPYEARLQRTETLGGMAHSFVRVQVGESKQSPVRQDLRFGDARIRMRLVDGDGDPLVGQVMLWRLPGRGQSRYEMGNRGLLGRWSTDGEGRLILEAVSPGRYRLAVGSKGYHIASPLEPVEIEGDDTVDLGAITLHRGHALTVTALGPDGEPLQGAMVGILPGSGTSPWEMVASGGTDRTGRVRLEGLPGGPLRVVGLFPGYAPAVAGFTMPGAAELRLPFEPGGHLEVWVYDRTGAALPFRNLVLFDEAGEDVTSWYEAGPSMQGSLMFTNHDGRLLLRNLRPGAYRLLVPGASKGGRASALVVRGALSTVSISVEP